MRSPRVGLGGVALVVIVIGVTGLFVAAPFFGDGDTPDDADIPGANGDDADSAPSDDDDTTNGETVSPWGPVDGPASELSAFDPPDPSTDPGTIDQPESQFAGFEDVAGEVGLAYDSVDQPGIVEGQGVYVADVANNGLEDILLVGGEYPTLFENTGDGYEQVRTFEPDFESDIFDEPSKAILAAHFFDYDNSGYEDLLLTMVGDSPVLYENTGGEFEQSDVTFDFTTSYPVATTSADFTGNGCLDVFIGSFLSLDNTGPPMSNDESLDVARNHPDVRPETDTGGQNYLLAGDCGEFVDISEEAGVAGSEWTLAVSAADFTGNGHIDIHEANDFTADHLYENQGDGTFEPIDLGPATDRNAMSSVARDVTGNHLLDLFVTNIYYEDVDPTDLVPVAGVTLPEGNNLLANRGGGTFEDIAPEHGLEAGSWGWAATVADYTNDGHYDIIHASSFSDLTIAENHPDIFAPPQVWKGTADSWEKIHGADIGFADHDIRGVASVDHNQDGTLDFVAVSSPSKRSVPGSEPDHTGSMLYANTMESDEYLQLWVRNLDGIDRNAGVYIETNERTIYRETTAEADLLSQDSRLIHVGLGAETVERVVVEWPGDRVTAYDTLEGGNRYVLSPAGAHLVDGSGVGGAGDET